MNLLEEIKAKIRKFLVRFSGQRELQDDENLFEVGFVNSLFSMQLVTFVENNFDFEIANEDLDVKNFSTINSICQFIQSKSGDGSEVNLD
nr:acyl carrier protein [uncultured Lachnoclostridium sp.]